MKSKWNLALHLPVLGVQFAPAIAHAQYALTGIAESNRPFASAPKPGLSTLLAVALLWTASFLCRRRQ